MDRRIARRLAEITGREVHDVAIVLGSGWVPAIDVLGEPSADFANLSQAGHRLDPPQDQLRERLTDGEGLNRSFHRHQ